MDETFDRELFDRLVREVTRHPASRFSGGSFELTYGEAAEICSRYCRALDKQDFEGNDPAVAPV